MGAYKGFVIQDPTDKQNIKGFFYMPRYVLETGITPTVKNPHYNLIDAVPGLAEVFNYYTGLNLKVNGSISILDARLSDYPVVYITTDSIFVFGLNTNAVRSYIMNGGFLILDNGTPWGDYTPAEATLMNLLYRVFGKDFNLRRIPPDHPVYHCFFDFAGVPPDGTENRTPPQRPDYHYSSSFALPPNPFGKVFHIPELERTRMMVSSEPRSLWGVWIGERLVAVYCDKGYGHLWRDGVTLNKHRDFASSDGTKYNFNDQLKMGVNLLVYALIQRGGIAKQYVDHWANADTAEYSARFIQHDKQ